MTVAVTFLPANKEIRVPEGTLVSDAARFAEITDLHLPCAGKGTCGKCLVELIVPDGETRTVAACQTRLKSDCTIRISPHHEHSASCIVADTPLDHESIKNALDFSPLCVNVNLTVSQPSLESNSSDLDRLKDQIVKTRELKPVHAGPKVLRKLAEELRHNDGAVSVAVVSDTDRHTIIDVKAGHNSIAHLGIACDIGTTTISLSLIELSTGKVLATRSDFNHQISRGADIISRIDYAKKPERLFELRDLVLDTINKLIASACSDSGVEPGAVMSMVAAGNCTMTHLLLGIPPRYIREYPYVPTVNATPLLRAADIGFVIHPEAPVLLAPGVGSYVGGDITAGLLCTSILDCPESINLFMDIGTNGEIVLGNAEFLMTCACSAGPAFEGSGIRCGMRAVSGAIDSFTIDPNGSSIDYNVIGGSKPLGICGSGLISLLGELFAANIIDHSGKFTGRKNHSRLVQLSGTHALILVPAPYTAHGADIVIAENDIDNLIRTKAALYAACDLMLQHIGIDFNAIGKVMISGGFGKYIDIAQAMRIGLFPRLDRSRFAYLGNSSLAGATMALLSGTCRETLMRLPAKMTYLDLSSDNRYMEAYMAALFLPHTDLSRFSDSDLRFKIED